MNERLVFSPCIETNRVIRENVVRPHYISRYRNTKKGTYTDIFFELMLLANRRYSADNRICRYGWKISLFKKLYLEFLKAYQLP